MDFELNEDQQQVKMSPREFAEGEIAPHVREWDEAQHFPVELLPKLAEQGLLGVIFPEEYGGAAIGCGAALAIHAGISRGAGPAGISCGAPTLPCPDPAVMFGARKRAGE